MAEAFVSAPTVAVLCGGVGAARYLRGLIQVLPPQQVTAVVNVADDMVLHGLHISPDIDTIVYTLADEIDPERGWGLRGETWIAMQNLRRYGDGDWFSLGDRDLATHLHRTGRLAQGAGLCSVTDEIARAWGVAVRIVPATEDPVSTRVTLAADGREIGFQEYFVGLGHDVPISAVRFDGVETASASGAATAALRTADLVVIAPSNPIVSIGPLLAIDGIRRAVAERSGPTIGISPIVGGAALKGPAARMLSELGHEASATGIAGLYADILDVLVIDDIDADLAAGVAATGVTPYVADTVMSSEQRSAGLARVTLSGLGPGGGS